MNIKPLSVFFLLLGGCLLSLMGIYFIFLRQPLLPEDIRYIDSPLLTNSENLLTWLQKVFWVLGCYILTTGILTVYIALTSFRSRGRGAFIIILIAGIASIGSMTIINFMLQSDFKWVLCSFTLPWFIALILYRFHK